jgi:hypothetical protein
VHQLPSSRCAIPLTQSLWANAAFPGVKKASLDALLTTRQPMEAAAGEAASAVRTHNPPARALASQALPLEPQHRNSVDFARLLAGLTATRSATAAATVSVAQQCRGLGTFRGIGDTPKCRPRAGVWSASETAKPNGGPQTGHSRPAEEALADHVADRRKLSGDVDCGDE